MFQESVQWSRMAHAENHRYIVQVCSILLLLLQMLLYIDISLCKKKFFFTWKGNNNVYLSVSVCKCWVNNNI